jgi:phosphoglucomutase
MEGKTHPLAGKPAPPELLIDVSALENAYYEKSPNLEDPNDLVSFGTSGHRGSPLKGSFNEAHILAITQAICDYRRSLQIEGPLYLGKDTHAASLPAERTALEVLSANGVDTFFEADNGYTPTPSISRAILVHNQGKMNHLADGIVITPSHNPPEDGGFKYNPPHGGPADTEITRWIQDKANLHLKGGNRQVHRVPFETACKMATAHPFDFVTPYVKDLAKVVDMKLLHASGTSIGVDPMGGAGIQYWEPIRKEYGLDLNIVNQVVDKTFGFMCVDHDGKIRMDCSSPYAMANLLKLKDRFDVAFGNDTDADRHGIVTRSVGLMNPNHFLAVAIQYLLNNRPGWPVSAAVGKTLVSSSLIDRVVLDLGRKLLEVPVGFKWFSPGLLAGTIGFGGEESAGASFLCQNGTVWTTDKDGLILGLLAAEICARIGKNPGQIYEEMTSQYGSPVYRRLDAPATPREKAALKQLSPGDVTASELAGEPILAKLTRAPGNDAPIDGLKVVTANGWFAARPSGTENVYKLYVESFKGINHLEAIAAEAQELISKTLKRS